MWSGRFDSCFGFFCLVESNELTAYWMRLLANSFYGDSNCFQFFCGLFLLKTVKQAKHISETRSSDHFTNYALYYVRLKGIRMSSSYSAPVVTAWHFSLRYVCVCNVCVCMLARVHVVMKYCISFIEYYTHVLRLPPVWYSKLVLFCRWQSNAIANYSIESVFVFALLFIRFPSLLVAFTLFREYMLAFCRIVSFLLLLLFHLSSSHLFSMSYAFILI